MVRSGNLLSVHDVWEHEWVLLITVQQSPAIFRL